jgi:hypothetical protein
MQIVSKYFLRQLFVSAGLFLFGFSAVASAQQAASPSPSPSPGGQSGAISNQAMDTVTVIGQLNEARDQIVPDLGATK